MRLLPLLVVGTAGLFPTAGPAAGPDPKGIEFFEAKVRPVLVQHCYACHSADAAKANKLKGGLALDTRDGTRKGGDTGPAVVPGKPAESLLVTSVRHAAGAPKMPPSGQLPAAVLADLETWIRMGAPDPRDGAAVAERKGMSVAEGRQFWSFRSPAAPPVPPVRDAHWPASAIDRFVLARLEAAGLTPTGDADPRALVRRLSFDLTGLPPAPEDVEAYLAAANENREAATDALIDRLLASRGFGERWGRHWLDLARYADSNGRDRNVVWRHAWRYRDYVIASFNRDKPFDVFVREQVAGDLLPDAGDDQRVATAFLAMGAKAFEETKAEVFRMDVIDEQIETISRSVLGLSVGCARCHDHKFDPIPTRDYYALAGILRSTEPLYGYGPLGIKLVPHADLQPVGPDADRLAGPARAHVEQLKAQHLRFNVARSDRYRVVRKVSDLKTQAGKPGADPAQFQPEIDRMEAEIKDWDARIKALEQELIALQDGAPPQPGWTMGARDRAVPEDCRVHIRGETTSLGDTVPRGTLQVLPVPDAGDIGPADSGRRHLARWLTSPHNPLTARVFVNRVWLHLFGRGLVPTPDDFGVNGTRPSHPELLDHLAVRFVESGWSVKTLVRDIVRSRTYQQASTPNPAYREKDPESVLLWRMSPRRLEAEPFRDALLAVSGQLDPNPPAEPFLDRFHPWKEAEYFSFKPPFAPDQVESGHRSVYLPVVRGVLPESLTLFDFADPARTVSQRDESTVPAQSLYLMNSPRVIGLSRHAAARLLAGGAEDAAAVDRLYRLAFARPPTADELGRALRYLAGPESLVPDPKAKTPADPRAERWASFCQAVFASGEFRTLR